MCPWRGLVSPRLLETHGRRPPSQQSISSHTRPITTRLSDTACLASAGSDFYVFTLPCRRANLVLLNLFAFLPSLIPTRCTSLRRPSSTSHTDSLLGAGISQDLTYHRLCNLYFTLVPPSRFLDCISIHRVAIYQTAQPCMSTPYPLSSS